MTTPSSPKRIEYNAADQDYRATYDGQLIGYRATPHEAEILLDEYALDLLEQGLVDEVTDITTMRWQTPRDVVLARPAEPEPEIIVVKPLFERVSAAEYDGGSKFDSLDAPFAVVVAALGEPHRTTEADYPDDDSKTDVCWSVRSTDNPKHIVTIWNYKSGPNYNHGEGTVDEIDYFSVYYTDISFWQRVHAVIVPPIVHARPAEVAEVCYADPTPTGQEPGGSGGGGGALSLRQPVAPLTTDEDTAPCAPDGPKTATTDRLSTVEDNCGCLDPSICWCGAHPMDDTTREIYRDLDRRYIIESIIIERELAAPDLCPDCGDPSEGRCPACQEDASPEGALLVRAYDACPDTFLKTFDRLGPQIQARVTFAVAAALGRSVGEVDAAWLDVRLSS